MSDLEKLPNPDQNIEQDAAKGEEKMALRINPIRRDALKVAISELTSERGEGAFNDANIVDRAAQNIVDHPIGPPVIFAEEKQKYQDILTLLREHPEEWERKPDTFEDQAKRRGVLPKVGGWFAESEGIVNDKDE